MLSVDAGNTDAAGYARNASRAKPVRSPWPSSVHSCRWASRYPDRTPRRASARSGLVRSLWIEIARNIGLSATPREAIGSYRPWNALGRIVAGSTRPKKPSWKQFPAIIAMPSICRFSCYRPPTSCRRLSESSAQSIRQVHFSHHLTAPHRRLRQDHSNATGREFRTGSSGFVLPTVRCGFP